MGPAPTTTTFLSARSPDEGEFPAAVVAYEDALDLQANLGNRQDLKDVRFEGLINHFMFHQGRYYFQDLSLSGGETEWQAHGWLDLEGNLALGIDVKLPSGFTPDLGNFSFLAQSLRDEEGRINLPLKLSGQASQPTVGVDLRRLRAR